MEYRGWSPGHGDAAVSGKGRSFWIILASLTIATLPYERIMGPASLRIVDGVVVLLCLAMTFSYWRSRKRIVFPLVIPMLFILASSLVASMLGFAYVVNIIAMVQEIYLWVFLVMMTNLLLQLNTKERDTILMIWTIVACLIALTTVMGMLHIGPSMFYEIPQRDRYQFEGFDRGVGTFINPNAAAAYLSSSFFVAIGAPLPVVWRILACGWIFVGMYGTGSNGAMGTTVISLGLLAVVFSMLRWRRSALGWAAVGSLGMAVALFLLERAPMLLPQNFSSGDGLLSTSATRAARALLLRFQLWTAGWREFQKRPWGFGPNSASEIQASLHNDYLAFLFERGPVGLIGWILLLLEPLIYVIRAALQSQGDRKHQWQILALGAGFLANGMNAAVHELSHTRQLWLLMAFIFAQAITLLRISEKEEVLAKTNPHLGHSY